LAAHDTTQGAVLSLLFEFGTHFGVHYDYC
jgi:hypothetical protein